MSHQPASTHPPVLLITGLYPPRFCGIGDYTAHLAKSLANLGTRVTVLTRRVPTRADRRDSSSGPETETAGVDVRRIIENWNFSEVRRVLEVIDELGPETVVHIQYGGFGMRRRPMVNLLPMILRARRPRCRVVLTLHEFRAHRLRARLPIVPMVAASHGVVCVDPPDLPYLRRFTRLTRTALGCHSMLPTIMPVAVDPIRRARWRRELGIAGDQPVVLYFGNIEPLKGFPDLASAVKTLRQGGSDLRLLVVGGFEPGNAWLERHTQGIRESLESGIRDGSVIPLPKVPAEQVSHCMHAADVAVFPYIHGARSNRTSLLAAIAHLLPVVTTDGWQTPPGFAQDFGVATVPAGNALALAEKLHQVLDSSARRQAMRLRMTTVRQSFSWRDLAQRSLAFYRDLLQSKGVWKTRSSSADEALATR